MSRGSSYDYRMEKLPVFISYPRSGSHWLNGIMELYFDRPRLRESPASFHQGRTDYAWFHDHDINSDLKLTHNNYLYLVRDPKDVIFSLLKAEKPEITGDLVSEQIYRLKKHHQKYLNNPGVWVVVYEKLKANLASEFLAILDWQDQYVGDLDVEKLDWASKTMTKERVIKTAVDKRYFNSKMLSSSYEEERNEFKSKYGQKIDKELPLDDL